MNIEKELLTTSHLQKEEVGRIAKAAASSKKLFLQLLQLTRSSNVILSKRAAWCLSLAAKLRPDFTDDSQEALVDILYVENPPDGLLRNILRILRDCRIHPDLYDRVAYSCFEIVQNPKAAIAIRAFALYLLGQIGEALPEIRPEVKAIIEYHFENKDPGLSCAATNVLNSWAKSDAKNG